MKTKETKKYAIELIREMNLFAKRWGHALLLVGFPEESRMVWTVSPKPLKEVQKLLLEGGIPVGIFSYKLMDSGEQEHFFWHVLDERAHDKWCVPYMKSIIAIMNIYDESRTIALGMNAFKSQMPAMREEDALQVGPEETKKLGWAIEGQRTIERYITGVSKP